MKTLIKWQACVGQLGAISIPVFSLTEILCVILQIKQRGEKA